MRTRNTRALVFFLFFYITFGIYLTINQERVIYQPSAQDFNNCPALATTEKVNHNGTRMYVSGTALPVVVLYHGNAGSACHRSFFGQIFNEAGYDFIIVEYTGYSNDPIAPSHQRTKEDVRNVIDFLAERGVSDVSLIGESLGTGVASYHASLSPPEKILLLSAFTDLTDMARERFWFYPTSLMVDNTFDNQQALRTYNGHVTILHGEKDTLTPLKLSQELYSSITTDKEFIVVTGAGHNNLLLYDVTIEEIRRFLAR
jgi:pimeloyl-ACP methyl ester carboxylesterase